MSSAIGAATLLGRAREAGFPQITDARGMVIIEGGPDSWAVGLNGLNEAERREAVRVINEIEERERRDAAAEARRVLDTTPPDDEEAAQLRAEGERTLNATPEDQRAWAAARPERMERLLERIARALESRP